MTPSALKAARTRLHLTQEQFAALVGVGARSVRWWESGGRRIPKMLGILLKYICLAGGPAKEG